MGRHVKDDKTKRKLAVDDALLAALDSVAQRHEKDDRIKDYTDGDGLPVPSLALRYLLQNEGLPLGLVYHVVGPPAVFKSTFAVEIGRWHRQCGGGIVICETESKPTPALRRSILGWDETAVKVRQCLSLEHWQRTIFDYVKSIQKHCGDGTPRPVAFIVDSYMGKMPERLHDHINRKGFAERHFGEAAMLIGDWLCGYTAIARGWPFTLIGVNHLKQSTNPITGRPVYRTPGGQYLQHQNVIEIRVSRMSTVRKMASGVPYYESLLRFYTSKNSRGAQDKSINVVLTQWNEPSESGDIRLYSNFEWWASSVRLLADGEGMLSADKELLVPLVKKIVDIRKRTRGDLYWCDALGVKQSDAMPAHELGMLLEQRTDVLKELYSVLGVLRIGLVDVQNAQDSQPKKPEKLRNINPDDVIAVPIDEEQDVIVDDDSEQSNLV